MVAHPQAAAYGLGEIVHRVLLPVQVLLALCLLLLGGASHGDELVQLRLLLGDAGLQLLQDRLLLLPCLSDVLQSGVMFPCQLYPSAYLFLRVVLLAQPRQVHVGQFRFPLLQRALLLFVHLALLGFGLLCLFHLFLCYLQLRLQLGHLFRFLGDLLLTLDECLQMDGDGVSLLVDGFPLLLLLQVSIQFRYFSLRAGILLLCPYGSCLQVP